MNIKKSFIFVIQIIILCTAFVFPAQIQASPKSVTECLDPENKLLEECRDVLKGELDEEKNQTDVTQNEGKKETPFFFTFLKMIFALALVIGLIYITLKFLNSRNKLFQQNNILENLGGITVGPNKSIQMIRIGDKVFVVGVGDNIQMLQEIEDDTLIEQFLEEKERLATTPSFLQTFMQGKAKDDNQNVKMSSADSSSNQFTNVLKSELNKLKKNRQQMMNDQLDKDDADV